MTGLVNPHRFGSTTPPPPVTTWNPSDKSSLITLSGGDLTAERSAGGSFAGVRSTTSKTTGKHHFEVTAVVLPSGSGPYAYCGVANAVFDMTTNPAFGDYTNNIAFRAGGAVFAGGDAVYSNPATAFTTGETIAIEVDVDAKTFDVYVDGAWRGPFSYSFTGAVFAFFETFAFADKVTVNFGASAFLITPQSGYTAWGS